MVLANGANTVDLTTANADQFTAGVDGGTGADSFTVANSDSFTIDGKGGSDTVTLEIVRDGKPIEIEVELQERPTALSTG